MYNHDDDDACEWLAWWGRRCKEIFQSREEEIQRPERPRFQILNVNQNVQKFNIFLNELFIKEIEVKMKLIYPRQTEVRYW